MRPLSLEEFLAESGASRELVERLVQVGSIDLLPDDQFDARDEVVASMANALLRSGIGLDDLAWAIDNRRFGLHSLGLFFTEPVPRTTETFGEIAASLGRDSSVLPAVYAALGLPEPEPDDHPRSDEAELILDFVRLWSLVDPTGEAHVRVARVLGDGARRIAEGWLDVWDEVAQPAATTQGAPTVGRQANPTDPSDPSQNPAIGMAELGRRLLSLVHERHVEVTLTSRIIGAMEGVLGGAGRLPERVPRPPAIAFIDLAGFTSLTIERGDEAAATVATRLFDVAETAVLPVGGRVVKQSVTASSCGSRTPRRRSGRSARSPGP